MPANPRAASVRLQATKQATLIAVQHDLRSGHIPAHVETDASGRNTVLQPPPGIEEIHALAARRFRTAQRRRQAAGEQLLRKRPENASPAYSALITFGRKAQRDLAGLDPARQDAALEDALTAVAAYLDVPVLWATVHRDESAIHLHAGLCAVRPDGQSIGTATKGFPGGKRTAPQGINTSDLQTVVHEALRPHLPSLERGAKIIDRLKSGERPEPARSHRQLRRDLGLARNARRSDVQEAVDRHRKVLNDIEAVEASLADQARQATKLADELRQLRMDIREMNIRRNRLQPFQDALGEIEAGRMRPDVEQRHWTVSVGTGVTAGIRDARFTRLEWQALRNFQGAHDRLREAERAAEWNTAEIRAESTGRQEIAIGNVMPGKRIREWLKGPNYDAARWLEVRPRISIEWTAAAWQRLREFAAGCTASATTRIAELEGRIGKALELARRQGNAGIIEALEQPKPEPPAPSRPRPRRRRDPDVDPSPGM